MEFLLRKASDWYFKEKITIYSIDDLKELENKYNNPLIIDFKEKRITVYDDCIEY